MEPKSNSPFDGPLAPRIGFNNTIQNPIPGGQSPKQSQNEEKDGGRFKFNGGKLVPFGAIALALLVLPITISQLNQSQDNRQRASEIKRFPTQVIPSPTPFPAGQSPLGGASPTNTPTASPSVSLSPVEQNPLGGASPTSKIIPNSIR